MYNLYQIPVNIGQISSSKLDSILIFNTNALHVGKKHFLMQSRVINNVPNIVHSWACTECEVSGQTGGTEALTTHMLLAHTLPGSIQIDKVKKEESPDRWILLSIQILSGTFSPTLTIIITLQS